MSRFAPSLNRFGPILAVTNATKGKQRRARRVHLQLAPGTLAMATLPTLVLSDAMAPQTDLDRDADLDLDLDLDLDVSPGLALHQ